MKNVGERPFFTVRKNNLTRMDKVDKAVQGLDIASQNEGRN